MRFVRLLVCSLLAASVAVEIAALPAKAAAAPITLAVDASEAPRKIFHARLVIPARPGPLTLAYPQWIPGEHSPTGPVADLAGVKFSAAGNSLTWRRDLVDMYAIHLEVPAGANAVEVSLDYLSPASAGRFSSGASATAQLTVLNWNLLLLYPKGSVSDQVTFAASLRLPPGWKFGTALPVAKQSGDTIEFQPVSLTTLVDSPVIAGAHFRAVPITPPNTIPHEIDMAADSDAALEITPKEVADFTQLVAETGALFGARHYRGYHFLLTLSNRVAHFGLEHHESSDNRTYERALLDEDKRISFSGLLPHEMVHSWNGKYRRPADLTTPDYQQPMQTDLLWVYEGLTTYLGSILTARSGLLTAEQWRDGLALTAAEMDHRVGRVWRPLQDTADAAQVLYGARQDWSNWRRGTDFYPESDLIWLEADTIIRRQSQGQRSLDDFCHLFHGGESGPPMVKTYTFDDVVTALNQIVPYDWRGFLTARLTSTAPPAPLGGIQNAGWKLVYTDQPSEYLKAHERAARYQDVSFSLGFTVKQRVEDESDHSEEEGAILDVIPGSPAAESGIGPGMKLVAVNGRKWAPEILRAAIRAAKNSREPLELLLENTGFYKTYRLDYHDGERYPHLERVAGQPDLLDEIIHPRAPRQ